MAKFKKENRFLVLKWDDIRRFLHPNDGEALDRILTIISEGRRAEGKRDNNYVVVNEDESYADVIWKLIEISQTNPEGLPGLLGNLKAEFYGFGT